MNTPKMTTIPQTTLFTLAGKDYYLVNFAQKDPKQVFNYNDVIESLRAAGHTPADVRGGDEILTHECLSFVKEQGKPLGLFGVFSDNPKDKNRVAFWDGVQFKRFNRDAEKRGLPHPVLCCK
jgi:hypothetical protein